MKSKFPIILSILSMVVFLITSVFCYIRINHKFNTIDYKPGVSIFTFDTNEMVLNVEGIDMLSPKKEAVATSKATLNAFYENDRNVPCKFSIIMNNVEGYTKTSGVDGIKSKEYTYEILKDGHIILEEREIPSYKENSSIELLSDILESDNGSSVYTIVFKFYANDYDQNHLVGKSLTGDLNIKYNN